MVRQLLIKKTTIIWYSLKLITYKKNNNNSNTNNNYSFFYKNIFTILNNIQNEILAKQQSYCARKKILKHTFFILSFYKKESGTASIKLICFMKN